MNKMTIFLLILIVFLGISLTTTIQSKAQTKGFAGVMPFISSNNRMGFFDQNNGKIYMYDDNISQCLFVGQVTALGEKIIKLTKS